MIAQALFQIAFLFYGSGWLAVLLGRFRLTAAMLAAAMALNALSLAVRYYYAWPLMPMYLGPYLLPLSIAALSIHRLKHGAGETFEKTLRVSLIFFLALVALFFPKDHYLPFLRSRTVFSHLFFVFGVFGKSFFFVAAVKAAVFLQQRRRILPANSKAGIKPAMEAVILGFGFWTFSMFSAELWSYIGWGSPVVWDDPAIVTIMATWFFYAAFLHLHFIRFWTPEKRGVVAACGALFVFAFTCYPEMGAFKMPTLRVIPLAIEQLWGS